MLSYKKVLLTQRHRHEYCSSLLVLFGVYLSDPVIYQQLKGYNCNHSHFILTKTNIIYYSCRFDDHFVYSENIRTILNNTLQFHKNSSVQILLSMKEKDVMETSYTFLLLKQCTPYTYSSTWLLISLFFKR